MPAVATPAGAVFHKAGAWPALQWQPAHSLVRRLQGRIVKATQAGRWGQGRALQRLLPHSCAAKSLAVQRVTANRGTWPPGVDGGLWETPEPQAPAVPPLCQQGYRPRPWRRGSIPTSTGTGTRPRSMPWMQDRARPALSLGALAPLAAPLAASNASGFRRARATADASAPCQRGVALSASAQWRFAGDLRAGFASVAHAWWGAPSPLEKASLRPGRQAGFLATPLRAPTETGGPPGGGSAPVSMPLARPGVARHSTGALPPCQGPHRTKVHGIRLADACLSTGTATGCLAQAVQPRVAPCLAERGLARARAKTRVTHMEEGFDCLGTRVRTDRGTRLWTPAKQNVRSFLATIRGSVTRHQPARTGHVSRPWQPVRRGWAPSPQQGASQRPLAKGAHQVFPLLWQWARRRHPRPSRPGRRAKYCRVDDGHSGVCFGHVTRSHGTPQAVRLFRASRGPMRRPTQIKGAAHP
jgi:RNA-directed DNA polymerase